MQSTCIIGILVSKNYTNLREIKEAINKIKLHMGNSAEICQISDNFMKAEIKKFVLEIGLKYSECLKYDEPYNIYSVDNIEAKFGREYKSKYYHIRNSLFLKYCDGIYAFIDKKLSKTESSYKIIMDAKKKKKNLKIIN